MAIAFPPAAPAAGDIITFTARAEDNDAVARIESWLQSPSQTDLVRVQTCLETTICQYTGGPYAAGESSYLASAWDPPDNQDATPITNATITTDLQ